MATRSFIGIVEEDKIKGNILSLGWISHNGEILYKHYNIDKIKELIELGGLFLLNNIQ